MTEPWFHINCTDPELEKDPVVRAWLDDVERRILKEIPQAPVIKFGDFAMIVQVHEDAELHR